MSVLGWQYHDTAVIKILRLFPTAPTSNPYRIPRGAAPVVLGSMSVLPPKTYYVYVLPYVLHCGACAHRFVVPDAFRPERWLVTASPSVHRALSPARAPSPSHPPPPSSSASWEDMSTFLHDDAGFIPFSQGPMNCVEKELAIMIAL
ncbi:hypothetical protein V8D89_009998 [Ganoderma adspersum]